MTEAQQDELYRMVKELYNHFQLNNDPRKGDVLTEEDIMRDVLNRKGRQKNVTQEGRQHMAAKN